FMHDQKVKTKQKDDEVYGSEGFSPTRRILKSGEDAYYRSNKLTITKKALKVETDDAVKFLSNYWEYLINKDNDYKLETHEGKGYSLPAKYFQTHFGRNAILWKCTKCAKTTQFNMGDDCIQIRCNGKLERLDSEEFCKDNYYAKLYDNKKVTPLFVKEHTAQLAKKDALDYQQQFIRKEINAL